MKKIILFSATALLIASCSDSEKGSSENAEATVEIAESTATLDSTNVEKIDSTRILGDYDHYYEDVANFLSGVSTKYPKEFKNYTSQEAWKNYNSQVSSTWRSFETRKLDPIKKWVQGNILAKNRNEKTVFYPFSGPDFNYVNAMLPEGDTYYMMGLEPVGRIPDFSQVEKDSLEPMFTALNEALRENIKLSFFITKQMKDEMNNEHISGTIPILMFFLARNDKRIVNIKPVSISEEGKLIASNESKISNKKFRSIVEFTFTDNGSDKIKKLYYFSMNIANSGFYSGSRLEKFLESMPNDVTTMVKSASFCMHEDKFSKIRDLILKKSRVVIQDDSGIPYKYFDQKKWDIDLYGTYDGPIDAFKELIQEDYKIAFEKAHSLPFRFGYDIASNLLISTRK